MATFLTNEQIIVAATDFSRVLEYNHIVDQHRSEAIRLSIDFCDDGPDVDSRPLHLQACESGRCYGLK